MALLKNIDFKGLIVNKVYVKVWQIKGNKNELYCDVLYAVDNSSEMLMSKTFLFDYNIDGENPIKQAYAHLKTLPEFADAIDC